MPRRGGNDLPVSKDNGFIPVVEPARKPRSSEWKKLLGTEEGKAFNYCLGNLGNNTSLKINKIKNFDNAINNMMET